MRKMYWIMNNRKSGLYTDRLFVRVGDEEEMDGKFIVIASITTSEKIDYCLVTCDILGLENEKFLKEDYQFDDDFCYIDLRLDVEEMIEETLKNEKEDSKLNRRIIESLKDWLWETEADQ